VRRLLDAYARHPRFAEWATAPEIRGWMETYFGEEPRLSRAHHNCMMTKHPAYGSLTGWHRDARYWSFERDDLVSVWLALGSETVDNGALWLVPQSHTATFTSDRFDDAKFFRSDLPENQALIQTAASPELKTGRCGVFPLQHAAFGRQESQRPGEVFAGVHVSRREQCAVTGLALGVEA
jgi:phytanoyl-CoA hydroxylase